MVESHGLYDSKLFVIVYGIEWKILSFHFCQNKLSLLNFLVMMKTQPVNLDSNYSHQLLRPNKRAGGISFCKGYCFGEGRKMTFKYVLHNNSPYPQDIDSKNSHLIFLQSTGRKGNTGRGRVMDSNANQCKQNIRISALGCRQGQGLWERLYYVWKLARCPLSMSKLICLTLR